MALSLTLVESKLIRSKELWAFNEAVNRESRGKELSLGTVRHLSLINIC